jgi:hypothetical protein
MAKELEEGLRGNLHLHFWHGCESRHFLTA